MPETPEDPLYVEPKGLTDFGNWCQSYADEQLQTIIVNLDKITLKAGHPEWLPAAKEIESKVTTRKNDLKKTVGDLQGALREIKIRLDVVAQKYVDTGDITLEDMQAFTKKVESYLPGVTVTTPDKPPEYEDPEFYDPPKD